MMKSTFCSATTLPWKHSPPLCHLDRSEPGFPTSRCWQRTRVRLSVGRAACRSLTPRVSKGNPGERSGEICGSSVFLGMFFDRGIMGLRSTQGDEKRLLFSNYSPWKHRPPLCHLDRSAAKWRDLRFSGPFLGMFFDRAYPAAEWCGTIHSFVWKRALLISGQNSRRTNVAPSRLTFVSQRWPVFVQVRSCSG